jgi:hypothetical protein
MLRREVERLVNQDRNYFAAAMLALGRGRRDDHRARRGPSASR